MGKKCFITARDVDELVEQGRTELRVDANTVLTDVGRERALERGLRLVRDGDEPAPARSAPTPNATKTELGEVVKKAVVAYLGRSPENIDAVIAKVIARF